MTTDRELLEGAAKAVGLELDKFSYFEKPNTPAYFTAKNYVGRWNPLIDDGDAFRLMVALEMSVHTPDKYNETVVAQWIDMDNENTKPIHISIRITECDNDPFAATRRAITRAAHEIGKEKKDE